MNSYELSRNFFNWCFENPDKISPNHAALYFFCIEHCNRLGWKDKFGLPTTMAKEAIGIRSYNTYITTLNELVEFGFIKLIEKSKNQYSSNIIALSKFNKAQAKALDKALIKHGSKQSESTGESIDSIDKQETKNKLSKHLFSKNPLFDKMNFKAAFPDWSREKLAYYYDSVLTWSNEGNKKIDWKATVRTWASRDEKQGKIKFEKPIPVNLGGIV